MAIFWNDFEILQLIDACDKGERGGNNSGIDMAQTLARDRGVALSAGDDAQLVRELLVLHDAGLVTWQVMSSLGRVQPIIPDNANDYLNNIHGFALTIAGRDRARGQMIQVPLPDPADDDGRLIAALTLREVARTVGEACEPLEAKLLLVEGGVSHEHVAFGDGSSMAEVQLVLVALSRGGSSERREVRQFVGAWLNDDLYFGPSDIDCEKINRDLARQG